MPKFSSITQFWSKRQRRKTRKSNRTFNVSDIDTDRTSFNQNSYSNKINEKVKLNGIQAKNKRYVRHCINDANLLDRICVCARFRFFLSHSFFSLLHSEFFFFTPIFFFFQSFIECFWHSFDFRWKFENKQKFVIQHLWFPRFTMLNRIKLYQQIVLFVCSICIFRLFYFLFGSLFPLVGFMRFVTKFRMPLITMGLQLLGLTTEILNQTLIRRKADQKNRINKTFIIWHWHLFIQRIENGEKLKFNLFFGVYFVCNSKIFCKYRHI